VPLFLLLFALPFVQAQDTFSGVDRIVAIGDIHGDYEAFTSLLRDTGLIDEKLRWTGGKTHLVQTGDVLDRGPDSRKVLDLIQSLEKQAPTAGGRVHSLIGNHEVMNMYGDLRYVVPGEYAAFQTAGSEQTRNAYWEQQVKWLPNPPSQFVKERWETEHPLGWVEHRMQFGTDGPYGKWMGAKNMVVKINDSVFLHGGISPKFAAMSVEQMNNAIRADLRKLPKLNPATAFLTDQEGPLWYRGLAQEDISDHVTRLTEALGVKRIVIGHTPTPGAVLQRFGGKVVMIDVGLSAYYGSNRACLIIEGEKLYAMHRGKKLALSEGLAYLRRAVALEQPAAALVRYVAQLERRQ
jgi:hypothetical protein